MVNPLKKFWGNKPWQRLLKLLQTRSAIGRLPKHKATLLGLGLRRIGHTVEREDTPAVRGMVNAVSFMVKVEE
ncbi:50S ribosomal subunit protein L30 [Salmonella enterica subsp. enterica]|uniref:Large ribosomal subunit protein uL30 n=3 Tax=Gammaproteobacteria TaxID=1236 RepID=A0A3S4FPW7_SALET|nr:50S ribosomal subunit protein L30 [Salmonella enterica subsp. enterica]